MYDNEFYKDTDTTYDDKSARCLNFDAEIECSCNSCAKQKQEEFWNDVCWR